jgi:hypothetical protein
MLAVVIALSAATAIAHPYNVTIRNATVHAMTIDYDVVTLEVSGDATLGLIPCPRTTEDSAKCPREIAERFDHVLVVYSRVYDRDRGRADRRFAEYKQLLRFSPVEITAASEDASGIWRTWKSSGATRVIVVHDFGVIRR